MGPHFAKREKRTCSNIKKVLKKYGMKGSIGINNHSSLVVNLKRGYLSISRWSTWTQ